MTVVGSEVLQSEIAGQAEPVPTIHIEPVRGWASLNLAELWEYRELLYFLVWRDLKVRYKQTVLGAGWAILQPVVTMVIFTAIFGTFAAIPSDGLPYPIFAFAALLPWTYFSTALNRTTTSIVGAGHLISKIYFPRLFVPLAGALSGLVDLAIGLLVLAPLMIWYGIVPGWGVITLPFFLVLAAATALAVGLWLSALNAKYRDVAHLIPFVIQSWMYASPVAYPVSLIPEPWQPVYSLNPMVGVIEGFRWGLLGTAHESFRLMAISALAVGVLLVSGIVFFRRMEVTFADVV